MKSCWFSYALVFTLVINWNGCLFNWKGLLFLKQHTGSPTVCEWQSTGIPPPLLIRQIRDWSCGEKQKWLESGTWSSLVYKCCFQCLFIFVTNSCCHTKVAANGLSLPPSGMEIDQQLKWSCVLTPKQTESPCHRQINMGKTNFSLWNSRDSWKSGTYRNNYF